MKKQEDGTPRKAAKLKWRLGTLPTPTELRELVNDDILSKDEAHQILISLEAEEDVKSLKSEINFLRDLVEKLATRTSYTTIWPSITTTPYRGYDWFQKYNTVFMATPVDSGGRGGTIYTAGAPATTGGMMLSSQATVGDKAVATVSIDDGDVSISLGRYQIK